MNQYPSLEAAFSVNPSTVADWGYISCREQDLSILGISFFSDIEDPGECRRAIVESDNGDLFIFTKYEFSPDSIVVLASSAEIKCEREFLDKFPNEYAVEIVKLGIVYFGTPS
ncbi:hypothetical protein N0A02_13865 [Paraburkholderia acidicola]|uniref:Integron gene cassette protein n=1 Tax=Paraburkholderia acidicola TaxID=1912599 RepID=A0ABV1LMJ2_9BURK